MYACMSSIRQYSDAHSLPCRPIRRPRSSCAPLPSRSPVKKAILRSGEGGREAEHRCQEMESNETYMSSSSW